MATLVGELIADIGTYILKQYVMTKQEILNSNDLVAINRDVNGNPRYYISFPCLMSYAPVHMSYDEQMTWIKNRGVILNKYRGKKYGSGFIFQSYNLKDSIDIIIEGLSRK